MHEKLNEHLLKETPTFEFNNTKKSNDKLINFYGKIYIKPCIGDPQSDM